MCFLKSLNLIFLISILSKNNCPSGISIVLPNDLANVVFPHPTGPTIAISSPGLILKFNLFKELNFAPLYFIFSFFDSIKPSTFFFIYLVVGLSVIFGLF